MPIEDTDLERREAVSRPGAPSEVRPLVVIRTTRVGGVWHVTRNKVFFGDYLGVEPARAAALNALHEIENEGGRAELIFEA